MIDIIFISVGISLPISFVCMCVCVCLKFGWRLWREIVSNSYKFSSAQFSHSVVSDSLRPHELQHARPPCLSPTPGAYSNSCPLSRWCQPSHPLLSPSPPALNLSQHQGLFKWVSFSHQVAKVVEFQYKTIFKNILI